MLNEIYPAAIFATHSLKNQMAAGFNSSGVLSFVTEKFIIERQIF